jgi:DNA polymerase (family 10)
LAALAAIRADSHEQAVLTEAAALARGHQIASDADLGPLLERPPAGTSADVLQRLQYMYDAGGWVLMESAIADLPADLRWLYESGAVTVEQLATIHRVLGATALPDLAEAVQSQAIQALPGLDASVERAVADALPALRVRIPRLPLGRAVSAAESLLASLRAMPGIEWASVAGSLRRGEDTVGDVEIVAAAADPARAISDLVHRPDVTRVLHRGPRRLYLLMERTQVGIRFPEPEVAGAALLHLTGSTAHLAALRAIAAQSGRRLEPQGLFGPGDGARLAANESDIYAALGLPFIPPEIRSGADEVARAARAELPALVARTDIRGDLHMHTSWSDGRDTVEAMVMAARALGYEYVAITDHSQTSAASRNVTIEGLKRQADEIASLRERVPDITILHGCEVDILRDGKLDFPDRTLETLDIVLASLHDGAGHSPDQLLKRYLNAMRNPLVTLITHPTNRLVPSRPGYDIEYDRLFEAAVATGTVLEIDGAPAHLDLNGELARRAVAAGAMVCIDSDCHRADFLERQMHLGVTMARRGWVEARHVLNARPLSEVRRLIARKRESSSLPRS